MVEREESGVQLLTPMLHAHHDTAGPASHADGAPSAAPTDAPAAGESSIKATVKQVGYGASKIGLFGSICLTTNNLCGSAMTQISPMFQQAGWLFPVIIFIIISLITYMSSMYISRTIALLPGNALFKQRIEFSRLARMLFSRTGFLITVFFIVASFIANNISNIVISSQVMDDLLMATAHKTCALVMSPASSHPFQCVSADSDSVVDDSPFGNSYTISLGYLIIMVISVPLSYMNLDDNIIVQVIAMVLVILSLVVWIANFCVLGLSSALMPAVAAYKGRATVNAYTSVLPTIIYNYGFVATIPSWLNEKAPTTRVRPTIWISILISTIMYIALGMFGAAALEFTGSADLLSVIVDGKVEGIWRVSKGLVYVFPLANLVSSIPVFCVIVRYNLINTEMCPLWLANFIAIVVPWALSLVFYSGNSLNDLLNWSSALLFVAINLVIPFALYYVQQKNVQAERSAKAARHAAANAASITGGLLAEEGASTNGYEYEADDDERQSLSAPTSSVTGTDPLFSNRLTVTSTAAWRDVVMTNALQEEHAADMNSIAELAAQVEDITLYPPNSCCSSVPAATTSAAALDSSTLTESMAAHSGMSTTITQLSPKADMLVLIVSIVLSVVIGIISLALQIYSATV